MRFGVLAFLGLRFKGSGFGGLGLGALGFRISGFLVFRVDQTSLLLVSSLKSVRAYRG